MSRRRRCFGLVLSLNVLVFGIAGAQTGWEVTIAPPLAPVAIGSCNAVELRVFDPAIRGTPRDPTGTLISMADFDMTATSPDGKSLSGFYRDAYHWSVCGCQGATAGTVGTITAKYPGKLLTAKKTVAGVTSETTATFVLGKAVNLWWNPPGCPAPPTQASTAGPTPLPTTVPTPSGRGAAIPALPPGPAPTNLAIAGTAVDVDLVWSAPTGSPAPTSYVVERWKTADPACCRATSPSLSTTRWSEVMMWPGPWTYQVTAVFADGRRGSTLGSYTYLEPEAPKGLTAHQSARNTVVLTWQPVQDAAYYVVAGPPSNVAIKVTTTTLTQIGVPVGNTTWKVAAMYQGKSLSSPQQASPFATTTLAVVNPHYRLIAEAIRVTSETADMPLSEDGMYDEVYVAALAEVHDRQTRTLKFEPVVMSHVHGDVTHWLPGERVKAGTASVEGGIRAGDVVSPIWAAPSGTLLGGAPLFVLWDGELLPGRHELLLHPTLWELDVFDKMMRDVTRQYCGAPCAWRDFLTLSGGRAAQLAQVQAAIAAPQISVVPGDRVWLFGNGELVHLENHDKDRPIGLENSDNAPGLMGLTGWMRDRVVVLNSEKIEAALASGQDKIEVRFWDHWTIPNTPASTINYLNGDYTLVIRIERMP